MGMEFAIVVWREREAGLRDHGALDRLVQLQLLAAVYRVVRDQVTHLF